MSMWNRLLEEKEEAPIVGLAVNAPKEENASKEENAPKEEKIVGSEVGNGNTSGSVVDDTTGGAGEGGNGNETGTSSLKDLWDASQNAQSDFKTEYEKMMADQKKRLKDIEDMEFDSAGMAADLFSAYANQYQKNAKRAMKGAMAESALLSGGYANSWGQMVGQQAYADVMSNMGSEVGSLMSAAYNMFRNERSDKLELYKLNQEELEKWYAENKDKMSEEEKAYYDALGVAINDTASGYADMDSVDAAAIEADIRESPVFAGLDDATISYVVKSVVSKVTEAVNAKTAAQKQLAADQATITLELIAQGVVDRDQLRMYLVASGAFANSSPEEIEAVIDTVVAEITEAQDLAKAEEDLALRQRQKAEEIVGMGLNNKDEILDELDKSGLFDDMTEAKRVELANAIIADVEEAGAEDLELEQNQLVRALIQESVDNWRVYDEEAIYYIMDESGLFENVSEAKRKEIAYGIIQEATQRIQGNKNANKTAVADAAGVQANLVQELIEDPSLNNDFYITMRLREKGLITDDMSSEDIDAAVKQVKEAAETVDEEPENDLRPITPEIIDEARQKYNNGEGEIDLENYIEWLAYMKYDVLGKKDENGEYTNGLEAMIKAEATKKIDAIKNRVYSLKTDTGNWWKGMDRDDVYTYKDKNGNTVEVTVGDIYRELVDAGMKKEDAKKWIDDNLGPGTAEIFG